MGRGLGVIVLTLGLLHRPAPAADQPAKDANLAGVWKGALTANGKDLPVVMRIFRVEGEELHGLLDLPLVKAKDLLLAPITRDGDNLRVVAPMIHVLIEGKLDKEGTGLTGEWKQGPTKLPITLKRAGDTPLLRRPQLPRKPYPYDEEEVVIENKEAGAKLAGTLSLPRGARGRLPAVLIIAGSGPQDRDGKSMGHRTYQVLGDSLTRRGFVVLRMDKRGLGKSTGSPNKCTTADFAADASLALDFLRRHAKVDPDRVGVIGHSEGGYIAPMLAAGSNRVAFLVLLGAQGLSGDEVLISQAALINKAKGVDAQTVAWDSAMRRKIFAIIKQEKDDGAAKKKALAMLAEERAKLSGEEKAHRSAMLQGLAGAVDVFLIPWMRYYLAADPRPYLRKVHCPVLALTGGLDLQVDAGENFPEIEKALKAAGNKRFALEVVPRANHLFQTCKTGSPDEYLLLEETFAPAALKRIGEWLESQAGKGKSGTGGGGASKGQ